MRLHRPFFNPQRSPYLSIWPPLDEQVEDFFFPDCETSGPNRQTTSGMTGAFDKNRKHSPRCPDESLSHGADCHPQLPRRRAFINVALRTANQRIKNNVVTNVGAGN